MGPAKAQCKSPLILLETGFNRGRSCSSSAKTFFQQHPAAAPSSSSLHFRIFEATILASATQAQSTQRCAWLVCQRLILHNSSIVHPKLSGVGQKVPDAFPFTLVRAKLF